MYILREPWVQITEHQSNFKLNIQINALFQLSSILKKVNLKSWGLDINKKCTIFFDNKKNAQINKSELGLLVGLDGGC